MSITIKGQPTDKVNPVYNPVNYYFESSNKNKPEFRYIIDVINISNSDKLFTLKVMPDFNNGYAVVELSRLLSNYLTYDFNLVDNSFNASNSYLKYKLEVGEEWLEEWEFRDYNFVNSETLGGVPLFNPSNRSNFTALQGTTQPSYQPGDMINVNITSSPINRPSLAGIQKVLEVRNIGGEWYVILDMSWVGTGDPDSGETTYADGKKTQFLKDLTINDLCVWNGVFPTYEFPTYDMDEYAMITASSSSQLLSNLPTEYTIREENKVMVLYNKYNNANYAPNKIIFTSDDGTIYQKLILINQSNWIQMVNIGADNNFGTFITGTVPFIKTNTKWYSVQFYRDNKQSSLLYKFNIDRSCAWEENIQMMFLDKLGSFIPFNFIARNEENHTTKSDKYVKYLGGLNSDKYDYNTYEGGGNIYSKSYQRSLVLRTNYLNRNQLEMFQHLVESPKAFIKYNNKWQEVIIKTNSIKVVGNKYTEPNKFELDVEFVNIDKINI